MLLRGYHGWRRRAVMVCGDYSMGWGVGEGHPSYVSDRLIIRYQFGSHVRSILHNVVLYVVDGRKRQMRMAQMTATLHPTYPNPTIQEVVCEIHFRLADGVSWDSSWFSVFFKKIEDLFPIFQPASIPVFVELTPHPPAAPALVVPQVIRYQHASRNVLIQLSDDRIAVNVLPVYPGWQQVSKDIRYAWSKLNEVVSPVAVNRIGLRYINAIERSAQSERLDKWLVPNDFVPAAILQSQIGLSSRMVTRLDDYNRIQVAVNTQASTANPYGTFLLDIDRIIENNIATDIDILLANVTHLHEDVWKVFNAAKSDSLEQLLQGDLL